jgi:heme-degrading monooxygenase HmoA
LDEPVTTVTLCRYAGAQRWWAFNQMGSSRRLLARQPGLAFWRLLGTGKGRGFSLQPDFSRYGLLGVWRSADDAERFFAESPLARAYRARADEMWTVTLRAYSAKGTWGGVHPFPIVARQPGAVAVLTRANIRLSKLVPFWRSVPRTTVALDTAPGLLASVGTGEIPFVRPATFSLWRSEEDLVAYAYRDATHKEVIRRRHDEGWYSEELFARFSPVHSQGTWNGRDPLAGLLP